MVAMYSVFGRQVGSHVLAMATLGTTFGASWYFTRGSGTKKSADPPINASSKDEENFIQEFLQQVEQESKAAKISGKEAH